MPSGQDVGPEAATTGQAVTDAGVGERLEVVAGVALLHAIADGVADLEAPTDEARDVHAANEDVAPGLVRFERDSGLGDHGLYALGADERDVGPRDAEARHPVPDQAMAGHQLRVGDDLHRLAALAVKVDALHLADSGARLDAGAGRHPGGGQLSHGSCTGTRTFSTRPMMSVAPARQVWMNAPPTNHSGQPT